MGMTQRLTDDEIAKLRERMADYREARLDSVRVEEMLLAAMLDEIEERRRIDARRLADAEQAFREECEAAAKEPSNLIWRAPFVPTKVEQLPSAIGVPIPPATWKPAGKDGGA
jgi:hypothetical protein